MPQVLIRGDGVAARCCARLLQLPEIELQLAGPRRAKVPAIMISTTTQRLFADVFEDQHIFDGVPRITRRIVSWGGAEPRELEHFAVVSSESDLLDRLGYAPPLEAEPERLADWTIHTAAAPSTTHPCGSRFATATAVILNQQAVAEACWVESTDDGWLFLLPVGGRAAWLLSVGVPGESLLDRSRLVALQIAEQTSAPQTFPTHPQIAHPLCGPNWLACGSAAMSFDPLCGEGSGNAIREAILASAVIRAAANEPDAASLLSHYSSRLMAGFQRHLNVCAQFYATGGLGPWWSDQLEATRAAVEWCHQQQPGPPEVRYQLRGFTLERSFATHQ